MAAVKKTYCKNGVTKNKTMNGKNERNLCWTFKRNKTIAVFAEHLETFCFFVQENNCSYYFQFFKIMNPVRIYLMDMIIPYSVVGKHYQKVETEIQFAKTIIFHFKIN